MFHFGTWQIQCGSQVGFMNGLKCDFYYGCQCLICNCEPWEPRTLTQGCVDIWMNTSFIMLWDPAVILHKIQRRYLDEHILYHVVWPCELTQILSVFHFVTWQIQSWGSKCVVETSQVQSSASMVSWIVSVEGGWIVMCALVSGGWWWCKANKWQHFCLFW